MHAAELLHDSAMIRMHVAELLHYIERSASSKMHDDRAGCRQMIRTHASSTMHDDAAIHLQADRVHGYKMHADRMIAPMQRAQRSRRQRVLDLERAIKTIPETGSSESSQLLK